MYIYKELTYTHAPQVYTHTHTHSKPFTLTPSPCPSVSLLPEYVYMLVSSLPTPNFSAQPKYPLLPVGFSVGSLRVFLRWALHTPHSRPTPSYTATISCTVNMYNGAGWCILYIHIYGCVWVCVFIIWVLSMFRGWGRAVTPLYAQTHTHTHTYEIFSLSLILSFFSFSCYLSL